MKRIVLNTLIAAVVGYGVGWYWHADSPRDRMPSGTLTAAPVGDGWNDLLSEPWADRWSNTVDDEVIFQISENMLQIYGVSWTKLRYAGLKDEIWSDFELHFEYRLAPGANSGIFLRWPVNTDEHRGFEIQLIDDHGLEPNVNRSGAIYDVVSPMFNMSTPAGEWNSMGISVHGDRVVVVHNGWKVVDADLSLMTMPIGKFDTPFAEYAKEGYMAFQDHGGEAWFRNVYLREITSDDAPSNE